MRNAVVSRVTPQLVRRNTVVVSTPAIRVAVKPSQAKSIPLVDARRALALPQPVKPTPVPAQPKPPPAPPPSLRSQPVVKAKRATRAAPLVRFIGDIDADSPAKIRSIRYAGLGRLLIIVGNGPSISQAPLELLKGHPLIDIMSINRPDDRLWPTSHWSFLDTSQFVRHEALWRDYTGTLINSTAIKRQKPSSMQIRNLAGRGFSRDLLDGFHIGQSTVFANMQTAHWMQYEQTYIFGCDMNPDGIDGRLHFYGVNPDVTPEVRAKRFEKEASYYEFAAEVLTPEERRKYTFCSDYNHWPFVNQFQRLGQTSAVPVILQHANDLQRTL